jgi:signal transduction histidine kinase
MGVPVTNRKPRFLWQGLLIVLPVFLLAAVGFVSLRQDRLLAKTEATQRAEGFASDLAADLKLKLDALARSAQQAERGFKIEGEGKLVFPPPVEPVPVPKPFELGTLRPEQARLWRAAQSIDGYRDDSRTALAAWHDFLESKPPSNFVAQARYVLGLLLMKSGQRNDAAAQFLSVIDGNADVFGESGLPLEPLARLKLLETRDNVGESLSNLQTLCSNLVYQPTLLTPELLKRTLEISKAPQAREIVQGWQAVWLRHQTSRELFNAATVHSNDVPLLSRFAFWFTGEPIDKADPRRSLAALYLAVPDVPRDGDSWFSCLSGVDLGELLEQTVVPKLKHGLDYFMVVATFEGRDLSDGEPLKMKPLASASEGFPGHGQVTVQVYLGNAQALFHQQRVRTYWFGALIAASAFAALVGLLAAYRSFRRQLRLSELKSNFVSSVSHELRAPIASVRLMAESLERGKVSEAPKQREYFSFIVQECRRLSSLIENVLDFSRIEQGRKQYDLEPTDVMALAEQTVALMQTYAAERQVNLSLTLDPLPPGNAKPQPLADGKALQQALINLIDNALKHSPKGQTVTVGLEVRENPTAELQPGSAGPGKSAQDSLPKRLLLLWVEDHGQGIPPQEHQKIFERFYRLGSELRRETPGVGIGLSIVKHIIESHGGRVLVRSAVGEGSRFTLELPMNDNNYGTHPDH